LTEQETEISYRWRVLRGGIDRLSEILAQRQPDAST
jgi:hypothetical protein